MEKTAQQHREEIARIKSKLANLRTQHEARTVAFAAERDAQNETDTATLTELAKLRLDLDVAPERVSLCKTPNAENFGPALVKALADARHALERTIDALRFRIEVGPWVLGAGPGDSELTRLTAAIARVEADLQEAEGEYRAAQAAAQAWLAG